MAGVIYVDEEHNSERITGLPIPVDGDEAATKAYVDFGGGGGGGGTRIISGGGVAWTGTGYNFIISACVYQINGVQYTSAQTPVTLTAAHATLDRIDVFYADADGLAGYITGSAAANPVAPSVDPATQIYLSFAYIVAASSTPSLVNEPIYRENTEWTYSDNTANINPDSTNNPHGGTKDIEGTATVNGNLLTLVKPSGTLLPTDYGSLLLQIRSKASWPNAKALSIFWLNGTTVIGTAVTLKHGTFAFDSSNTTIYQQIVIPTSVFNTGSQAIDRLRITVTGGASAIGWYLDDIILQTGIGGGGGGGDFSTNTNVSEVGEIVVFANTVGKLGKRSQGTGLAKLTSGVLSTATAGTDYLAPSAIDDTAYDATTWNGDTTHAPSKNAVRDKFETLTSPVDDTAYDATTWNGDTTHAPSKNAVRDKIETLSAGGTNAFGTISVSGQSDVVADAAPDTLTLVAGTNVTLTTNASTDTITIAAAGGSSGTTVTVSGSDFVSTGLGTNDITGLSVAVTAGHIYEVEAFLDILPQNTNGMQVGLICTGGDGGSRIIITASTTTPTIAEFARAATGPGGSNICFDQIDQPILMHGVVRVVTSGGVIKVQGVKLTSSTFTCRIGSWLRVTQLQ